MKVKPSGRKQKGRRLELKVAKLIRRSGLDKKARPSFQSGAQWQWKSDIYTSIPFSLECKNAERIRLWDWWEQARAGSTTLKPPVLVVSSNHRPILAIMDIDEWLNVIKELEDYKKQWE
jgi:hypothetical protein